MTGEERLLAVLRIRGPSGLTGDVKKTFSLLSLKRSNSLALMASSKPVLGMLNKLKAYVAWGEVGEETLLALLEVQGRSGKRSGLIQEMMEEIGCDSFKALAGRMHDNPGVLKDLAARGLKAVFRLRPLRKGFRGSTKSLAGAGGRAGYIGTEINELILRMVQRG